MVGAENIENTAELAIQTANALNPIKGVAQGAQVFLDVKAAAQKLAKSGAVMAKLGRAMAVQLPKVEAMRKKIEAKKKTMEKIRKDAYKKYQKTNYLFLYTYIWNNSLR